MDVLDKIISYIGSVGFPAVMCLLLWYYIKDNNTATLSAINQLTESITDLKLYLTNRDRS